MEKQIEAMRERHGCRSRAASLAGAVVSIGRDGKVCVERDLLKPEDSDCFRSDAAKRAAAEAPRVHSAVLVRRLTAQRTLALQAVLVQRR